MAEALAKYATMPLSRVMASAIRLARDGFVVDSFLQRSLLGNREHIDVEPWVQKVPPNAQVFNLREDTVLRTHTRIAKAIGPPPTTLHHRRHGYAVAWLKRGGDHQVLKDQVGHPRIRP